MPVYIHQNNACDLITQIEGDYGKEEQNYYTFNAQYNEWLKFRNTLFEDSIDYDWEALEVVKEINYWIGGAIYGAGGVNRYQIYGSGEIKFDNFYCMNKDKLELAKKLGFRIRN